MASPVFFCSHTPARCNKVERVRTSFSAWLSLLAILCSFPSLFAAPPAAKPIIVAYVFPQHALIHDGDIAAQKVTRINYAFANIKSGLIVNGFENDDRNLAALVALKKQNPSLTVLVSVGGWLWSGAFSDMALTQASRAAFIGSVVEFVGRNQLDGLDIDWEYPGLAGSTTHFRPEDKQNYTLLLKELRSRFDELEKQFHRPLYLTIATGASPEFLAHTDMDKVQQYVDTVNLMAYDYYEPDSDAITGHHAPLFPNPADPKKVSADASVREYEKAGVPPGKIVLGVPFYGHVWGQVPEANHGLFQPGKNVKNAWVQYGGVDGLLKNGFVRYWDPVAKAPYLYNAEKQTFVSYDDPESLVLKCKYVLEGKLRGVMFWDYESDPTGTLLDAVDAGLNKNSAAY
jgi:chitinase